MKNVNIVANGKTSIVSPSSRQTYVPVVMDDTVSTLGTGQPHYLDVGHGSDTMRGLGKLMLKLIKRNMKINATCVAACMIVLRQNGLPSAGEDCQKPVIWNNL